MGGLVFCLCWICWVMQKAIIELFEEFLGGSKCWRAHFGEHYTMKFGRQFLCVWCGFCEERIAHTFEVCELLVTWISCLGRGIRLGIIHQIFGISSRYVWCGYCGLSKMVRFLKMKKHQGPSWSYCWIELCLIGLLRGVLQIATPYFAHNSFASEQLDLQISSPCKFSFLQSYKIVLKMLSALHVWWYFVWNMVVVNYNRFCTTPWPPFIWQYV